MSANRTRRARLSRWLGRLRGVPVRDDLRRFAADLAAIRARTAAFARDDDAALAARARAVRASAGAGIDGERRTDLFALVCEASRRTIALDPYDEQIVAGLALTGKTIVEMPTGEGKTLVAVFPAVLHALAARGVHVLTFNDYLARRDADWMGPVFRFFGLSVGCIFDGQRPDDRRRAYAADVTYATAKQVGFDLLRDGVALDPGDRVLRPLHAAIVDEADALMIDEARVPIVLAATNDETIAHVHAADAIVASLQPEVDFELDEVRYRVTFTEGGLDRCEARLGGVDLHAPDQEERLAALYAALHARALLRRDRDYLVRDGRIEIVDENTGRVIRDRKWPEGLHAALEAKEGLGVRDPGTILATVTVHGLLRSYGYLCGMTATAEPAAEELFETYGLETVVVPPHRACIRADEPPVVFATADAKAQALVAAVHEAHAVGRPVLVGTRTVEESEALSERLARDGIDTRVLNARHDAREAEIVAEAGAWGGVTIATNMAGRGTDIRLGGADERDRARVAALGGLLVIGTNMHDSRRIDDQLRGRAGRQGDPGTSRSFVSLEDELVRRYGGRRQQWPAGAREIGAGGRIEDPVVLRWLGHLQRVVEGQCTAMRSGVRAYGDAIERQRRIVADVRAGILTGEAPPDDLVGAGSTSFDALREHLGEEAARALLRRLMLLQIDRHVGRHLSLAFALREAVVLERLADRDPRVEYERRLWAAFEDLLPRVEKAVLEDVDALARDPGSIDPSDPRLRGPSSTWTYLVDDDPFGERFAISGPYGVGAVAGFLWPLLLLWSAARLWIGRKRRTPAA